MTDDIYYIVANNIKYYRKKNNYTQLLLAEKSGYSHEFIRRIEAPNIKKQFSLDTIFNISKSLNIDVWRLFCKEGKKENMNANDYTFYDYAQSEFENYLGNSLSELSQKSEKYQKLSKLISEEENKFPNISEMIFGVDEPKELSKDQVESLKKIIDYKERIQILEEKEIFFKGFIECYNIINRMKNIDEKHT